ncbi:MAG: DUF721 domain-containing protein [Pseudomonadota bacterium]
MADAAGRVRNSKGFRQAGSLVERDIRTVGEARGFAVSKLMTHWGEIAGEGLAGRTRPVEVRYGRDGLGATLTVLTTGAEAPMVEMAKEKLRERVNGCYGYNAIARIRITQTAPTGFAEGQADFDYAKKKTHAKAEPDAADIASAARAAGPVKDPDLRAALENLGARILSRHK